MMVKIMRNENSDSEKQVMEDLATVYRNEKPRLMARMRAAGRSLEEAEDLLHDIYAETMQHVPWLHQIRNLPAWLNSLFSRRMIDEWRRRKTRSAAGETEVAHEVLQEIMVSAGLDPLDAYVQDNLVEALNDALAVLPVEQRQVVEAQVFGGQTFKEISEKTGIGIDTLTARKRYALRNLARALEQWMDG